MKLKSPAPAKLSSRSLMCKRLSPFWQFQLAGWAAFSLLTLPLKIQLVGSISGGILLMLIRDGSSFSVSLILRQTYLRMPEKKRSVAWMTTSILAGSLVGAASQMAFFFALHKIVSTENDLFRAPYRAFEVFYERLGLLVGWSSLYFSIAQMRRSLQTEVKLAKAEAERREIELQMLRAQINPHFLFNSLNTILGAVEKGRPGISTMLQALSDYLNYALVHKNADLVLLGEEAEALNSYIVLEKARLGRELEISCNIAPETKNLRVPGVLLQPIVENAIKFGRETWSPPVIVRLTVAREAENVIIEVFNTGRWIPADPARTCGGIGLENIRRRLEWLFPGKSRLDVSPEDGWVAIQIRFPATL